MANLEVIVVDWLKSKVGSIPVSGDIPATRPDVFITVDRTGGPRESMVLDKAEILIEVYNKTSRLDASNLANELADQIVELEAYSHNITHADVNSIVNLDDIIGQFHRYQIYCNVFHRR